MSGAARLRFRGRAFSHKMITPYYQHDRATIYHGDARDVLPLLPKVDILVTEPPIGSLYVQHNGGLPPTLLELAICKAHVSFIVQKNAVVDFHALLSACSGAVVLDPFMGHGNILVAALRRGKNVVGIDLNEDYCNETIRRLEECL